MSASSITAPHGPCARIRPVPSPPQAPTGTAPARRRPIRYRKRLAAIIAAVQYELRASRNELMSSPRPSATFGLSYGAGHRTYSLSGCGQTGPYNQLVGQPSRLRRSRRLRRRWSNSRETGSFGWRRDETGMIRSRNRFPVGEENGWRSLPDHR